MASATASRVDVVVPESSSGVIRRKSEAFTLKAKEVYDASIKPHVAEPLERRYEEFKKGYPVAAEKLNVAEKKINDVVDRAILEGKTIIDKVDTVIDARVSAVQQGYESRVKPAVASVSKGVDETKKVVREHLDSAEVKNVRSSGVEFAGAIQTLVHAVAHRTVTTADGVVEKYLYPLDDQTEEERLKIEEDDPFSRSASKFIHKIYLASAGKLINRSGVDPEKTKLQGSLSEKLVSLIYWNVALVGGTVHVAVDAAPKYQGPGSAVVHKLAETLQNLFWSNSSNTVTDTVGILPSTPSGSTNSLNTMPNHS